MTQFSLFKQKVSSYFQTTAATVPQTDGGSYSRNSYFMPRKMKRYVRKSLFVSLIAILLIIFVTVAITKRTIMSASNVRNASSSTQVINQQTMAAISTPSAVEKINKNFSFPITDANGNTVSHYTYTIQSVQEQKTILIQGQTAYAVPGTTFLIVNLMLTNNYTKSFNLNTRDFIRLLVNNSNQKLAPNVYNDPVAVQAISTDYTRLGFSINAADKNLILQVGEITGPKTTIKLKI
jgi:hypothetical protein